jgi:hypothetical protein
MAETAAPRTTPPGLPPLVARALAVPAVLALLAAGLGFLAGVVAPGDISSIVLGAVWFVAAGIVLGFVGRRWRGLELAVRGTFLVAAFATAFAFYWTSIRDDVVDGPVSGDGDVDDFVDLGGLKGNVGDQQYAIPPRTDLARYSTVVVWCRAFTVSFAKAEPAAA